MGTVSRCIEIAGMLDGFDHVYAAGHAVTAPVNVWAIVTTGTLLQATRKAKAHERFTIASA